MRGVIGQTTRKVAILALPICTLMPHVLCADSEYTFLEPTERDRRVAKLAADWLLHDDWGGPRPPNAYSGTWKNRVPQWRAHVRAKYKSIPLDIIKRGTNTHVLLTYIVESRSVWTRSFEPDPWPTPRLTVREYVDKDGRHFLILRWAGSIQHHLLVEERGNRIAIKELYDVVHID